MALIRFFGSGQLECWRQSLASDPAAALRVAVALNAKRDAGHEYDPDYGELLAAAQAANGQFAKAVQSELAAIGWARHYGWNVRSMETRLAA